MIYFIQGKPGTPIKIGYTANEATLRNRVKAFQTGYPYTLKIRFLFENGTEEQERALHRLLAESRLRGEWFEDTGHIDKLMELLTRFPDNLDAVIAEFKNSSAFAEAKLSKDTLMLRRSDATWCFSLSYALLSEHFESGTGPVCYVVRRGSQPYYWYRVNALKIWLAEKGIRYRLSEILLAEKARLPEDILGFQSAIIGGTPASATHAAAA